MWLAAPLSWSQRNVRGSTTATCMASKVGIHVLGANGTISDHHKPPCCRQTRSHAADHCTRQDADSAYAKSSHRGHDDPVADADMPPGSGVVQVTKDFFSGILPCTHGSVARVPDSIGPKYLCIVHLWLSALSAFHSNPHKLCPRDTHPNVHSIPFRLLSVP